MVDRSSRIVCGPDPVNKIAQQQNFVSQFGSARVDALQQCGPTGRGSISRTCASVVRSRARMGGKPESRVGEWLHGRGGVGLQVITYFYNGLPHVQELRRSRWEQPWADDDDLLRRRDLHEGPDQ